MGGSEITRKERQLIRRAGAISVDGRVLARSPLAINVSYLDVTVPTLAPGHGVELSDFIGAAALLAGVIALW